MTDGLQQGPSWTPQQLGKFVDQVRDDRFFALWMLAATTGLGVSSIVDLRRDQVDIQEGTVTPSTKRSSMSSYALDPDTYDALRDHVISWDKERTTLGQGTKMLFVWSNGEQLDSGSAMRMFDQHCANAGVPTVPVRGMRFAYVVSALESGIPTGILSERLGTAAGPVTIRQGVRSVARQEQRGQTDTASDVDRSPRRTTRAAHLRSL